MTDAADVDRRLTDALERLGQVLRARLRSAAAQHGLSPIQAQLLLRLVSVSEADQQQTTRLADWFDVRAPTVSDAVAALRRKGLVDRRSVDRDARRVRLEATARGRRVAADLHDWDGAVRAELTDISDGAKAATTELLLELIGRLQRAGLVTVARTCSTCRFFRPDAHQRRAAPHHCSLLDLPLGAGDLRLDCAEHQAAS